MQLLICKIPLEYSSACAHGSAMGAAARLRAAVLAQAVDDGELAAGVQRGIGVLQQRGARAGKF